MLKSGPENDTASDIILISSDDDEDEEDDAAPHPNLIYTTYKAFSTFFPTIYSKLTLSSSVSAPQDGEKMEITEVPCYPPLQREDREIMRVLVECCLQEKVFNNYHCVLASKLCSHATSSRYRYDTFAAIAVGISMPEYAVALELISAAMRGYSSSKKELVKNEEDIISID
ncbi:hypothetical protein Tco_0752295 [Tanacetum coccineum]|uniref:Uncharacterized protein n=1 Tax=Tanacetum coccineum TaxID=301880 RepID=A0ABQ4Z6H5_9ASTR